MSTTMTKTKGGPPAKQVAQVLDRSVTGYKSRGISKLHVNLPADLHRQVKIHAATFDMTTTDVVCQALERYLARK